MTASRLSAALLIVAAPALAQTAAPVPAPAPEAALPDIVVRARELDERRNMISPRLGTSQTTIDRATIEALPQGANATLNQVLLQAPGVVQDSFGEIHVRGEHSNLQIRLNGVSLPEGIRGFGSLIDTRAMSSLTLITGALPAQYGLRTAGIIDITLRSGAANPGGEVGVYGGSRGTVQPYAYYGGVAGGWEYFLSGSGFFSQQGIENPTSSWLAKNDRTQQYRGLGYASRLLDENTRVSLILGASVNRFRIPVNPGQTPEFTAFGVSDLDSTSLRARQWERNYFGVASLQQRVGSVDWQVSAFARRSSVSYVPDVLGELVFNGVASQTSRYSFATGVQGDLAWQLDDAHTLRTGVSLTRDRSWNRNLTWVLPLDADGAALDDPFAIGDRNGKVGMYYSAWIQDEWRITDRLTLNFGLRADYMDAYVNAGQLSPRVNLVWRATDSTTLHAGYARTFTPPRQELIAPTTLAAFEGTTGAAPNQLASQVKPERSHYFDIGVSQRVTPNLTLGLDAYYKDIRDMLDEGQFGNALIFSPFNYQRGRIAGLELTANWRSERWIAYASFAWARAVARSIVSSQFFFDQDELDYIKRNWVRTDHDQALTASAAIAYIPWDGGRVSVSGLYGSGLRRGFANTGKLPDYWTMNLGVAQDFTIPGVGRWTARFDVVNLFDRKYELRDGSGIGVGAPQWGMRRGFFVGLSYAL